LYYLKAVSEADSSNYTYHEPEASEEEMQACEIMLKETSNKETKYIFRNVKSLLNSGSSLLRAVAKEKKKEA
jgi:hypothetical protein